MREEVTAMRSDSDIKSNVEAELRCHPNVDESCIAVNVAAGTVTLMGYVRDFFQKYGAEDAVKRVVLLTLKSPRFLYLGLEDAKPDDFLVAERLSFGLWDSLPDSELIKVV